MGSKITIDPNLIHYKELVVTGSSAATPAQQREVLKMISEGSINIRSLITDVLPLTEWQKAFEMKADYKGLKTLLKLP